jgi:hypothetical protein
VSDVVVEMSARVPTVAIVTFAAEGPGEPVVHFGVTGEEKEWAVTAEPTEEGRYRAVLVGVPAGMSGWCQPAIGDTRAAEPSTYQAGEPPGWLSTTHEGTPANEGFFALAVMSTRRGAAIIDTLGRPVWWWEPEGVRGILSRAVLTADGRELWLNAFSIQPSGNKPDDGMIIKVSLDGLTEEILTYPKAHHDFLVHEDGTLVLPVLDDREVGGRVIRGDAIVEIAPDGTEEVVWTSWDSIPYNGEQGSPEGWWIMLNHLQYVAEDNDYVLSMKNLDGLARVDAATGQTEWIIGSPHQTMAPDPVFRYQHGFDVISPDEILLFDNKGSQSFSRILRLQLDPVAGAATASWSYEDVLTSVVMGDVMQHEDGNLSISWSSDSIIDEVTPGGRRISRIQLPDAENVGYLTFTTAIGRDAELVNGDD